MLVVNGNTSKFWSEIESRADKRSRRCSGKGGMGVWVVNHRND